MVYAPTSGQTILFGGDSYVSTPTYYNETYIASLGLSAWLLQAGTTRTPAGRFGHTMTYDPVRGEIIMFGGATDTALDSDTWAWRGEWWMSRADGLSAGRVGPEARMFHSLVYDSQRQRLVLFGGGVSRNVEDLTARQNDLWELDDGRYWTRIDAAGPPSRRRGAASAYHATSGKVMFFGGSTAGVDQMLDDTWTWDGAAWAQLSPATKPSPREGASMAYDPIRDRIVLFGGTAKNGNGQLAPLGDTWEWDGSSWTQMSAAAAPPPAAFTVAYYDPDRRTIALGFGIGIGAGDGDIWEWDGSTWTKRDLQGSAGNRQAGAYHAAEHRLIVFGGPGALAERADAWTLESRPLLESPELCLLGDVDDDGDGFAGCADPDCWARCTPLCPPGVASCPASAPKCGDSTCTTVETHSLCSECP